MQDLQDLPRLLRTLRHLRPEQLWGQLRNRIRPHLENAVRRERHPSPPCPVFRRLPTNGLPPPNPHLTLDGGTPPTTFTFANETHSVGSTIDWTANDASLLWRFNLHYFEWLRELNYDTARSAVCQWISRCAGEPPGHPSRLSYPLSLRIMNWMSFFFGLHFDRVVADKDFRVPLWQSLYRQTEWLRRHLETHILGNHLLENFAALTLMGGCFETDYARRWYARGHEGLLRELNEQLCSDGTHYERSPMYQCRVLFVLHLLSRTGRPELAAELVPYINRMTDALRRMIHPDGNIALLNDSAFGIYPAPADLLAIAPQHDAPAYGAWALPAAGYYGFRGTDGSYIVCDAAPIGPDYQPGHAHGDILSFELSLRNHRVIVDAGVYEYQAGDMRDYCRSTRAHNTIEIDGLDQCEFWADFRVGRRAHPRDVVWRQTREGFSLNAWHDGYRHLPGHPRHNRIFEWDRHAGLHVHDTVTASKPHTVVSRLHLHPECRIESMTDTSASIAFPTGRFTIRFAGDGLLRQERAWYCSEFNRRVETTCLARESHGATVTQDFSIIPG